MNSTTCHSHYDAFCNDCRARAARETVERFNDIHAALARAMVRAGVDGPVMVCDGLRQDAWADVTGYDVMAPTQQLAERAADWLCRWLVARGHKGSGGNVWGQRWAEGVSVDRHDEYKGGHRVLVRTRTFMIGD